MARVLHPNHAMPAFRRAVVILFWVAGAVFLLGGLVTIGHQTAAGTTLLGLAALFVVLGRSVGRDAKRRRRGLTVVVKDTQVEFWRQGCQIDTVPRNDVGLVAMDTVTGPGAPGLVDFRLFRPDGSLLGKWETEWFQAGSIRASRAFARYGYPWMVHDRNAFGRENTRAHSDRVPDWADRAVRS